MNESKGEPRRAKITYLPTLGNVLDERMLLTDIPQRNLPNSSEERIISFTNALREKRNVFQLKPRDELSDEERYKRRGGELVIDYPLTSPRGLYAVYENTEDELLRTALFRGAAETLAEVVLGYPDNLYTKINRREYEKRVTQEIDFLRALAQAREEIGALYTSEKTETVGNTPEAIELLRAIEYIRDFRTKKTRRKRLTQKAQHRAEVHLSQDFGSTKTNEKVRIQYEREREYLRNAISINSIVNEQPHGFTKVGDEELKPEDEDVEQHEEALTEEG